MFTQLSTAAESSTMMSSAFWATSGFFKRVEVFLLSLGERERETLLTSFYATIWRVADLAQNVLLVSSSIKLQILLLFFHTFLTEVVGRSC